MSDTSRLKEAVDAAAKVANDGGEALARLEGVIRSPAFERALRILLECEGIIYLIGMGKSGLVGQKIAATLTSTGAAANYIHAGDALHGDLGAIRPIDVTILISKSGETKEVVDIIPFLRGQKNKIIAITNEEGSTLATRADVTIPMRVTAEGCPLNLAPMTSSTVTMTLGDAMAGALIVARGISKDQFARYHPGGRLGYLLTAKVADMLSNNNNPVVKSADTLRNAVVKLVESRLGGVNIVGDDGRLGGVLTDGDLKRILVGGDMSLLDKPVSEVMTKKPAVISLNATAAEAIEVMENRERQISVLPVVDDERRPVGILRLHDVIRTHL